MRGLVFNAPGDVAVTDVPDPGIVNPGDAVVRVTKAGICGSDMHIYNHGDAFGFDAGCRLGHEFVGVVEAVGPDVTSVRPGDRIVAPFWLSCGECHFCKKGLPTSCISGGCFGFQAFWGFGGAVEGGQSEFVRVPMADGTLVKVPDELADVDDHVLLPLVDVFTTAYHAARGSGVGPGQTALVVGDGAVGLLACQAARLLGAERVVLAGHHDDRLAIGTRLGATHSVNTKPGNERLGELLGDLTGSYGPDVVIDAISSADSLAYAANTVQPGGTISWVGMEVFLAAPQLPWDLCFLRNLTIRGGVAPVRRYLPDLWPLVASGALDPSPVLTHDMPLEDAAEGYTVMATRAEGSVKVCLTP
ncbi:MAG: alcohol dehydrogenase catalytic domain-containing protein [Thermoleophilia bacterium]